MGEKLCNISILPSNLKNKMNKHNYEIIIRPHSKIKSRQWFSNQLKIISNLLQRHISKKKKIFCRNKALTLLITDDREIQNLNKEFRRINKPTDVLSFHLIKSEQLEKKYLGDIFISSKTALKQANQKRLSVECELQTLIIHGYLHLLGYDHKTIKEAKLMFSIQSKILIDSFL